MVVQFDGYDENSSSIKDCTHLSRGQKFKSAPAINFSPKIAFVGKKKVFLANSAHKSRIGSYLESNGCIKWYVEEVADLDTFEEGIRTTKKKNTVMIGEDSDLFVLLLNRLKDTDFSLHNGVTLNAQSHR